MWPKEHGSSVMVAAAFLVGAAVAASDGPRAAGWVTAAMALVVAGTFLLRRPLAVALATPPARTRRRALSWIGVFALPVALAAPFVFLALPWPDLAILAAASAPVYVCGLVAVRLRAERALWVEVAGAAGAALAAPAAHLAVRGTLEPVAFQTFLAVGCFFLGGLFHVRSLFRRARRREGPADPTAQLPPWAWTALAAGAVLVLVVAGRLAAGLGIAVAAVALLRPFLLRGALTAHPMRVGMVEAGLAAALVVAVLLAPGTAA